MNTVCIIGNLGRDPELQKFQDGTSYLNFQIATNAPDYTDANGNKKEGRADWHFCVAYGKMAEAISNYNKKGSKLGVTGSLHTNVKDENDKKEYFTFIRVRGVEFLTPKGSHGSTGGTTTNTPPPQTPPAPTVDEEDDLPF